MRENGLKLFSVRKFVICKYDPFKCGKMHVRDLDRGPYIPLLWRGLLSPVAASTLFHIHLQNKQSTTTYRVIQEESAVLWEMIVCVILSKKVHMNMGPILNGYRDNGKKKIRTILRARTAIT